MFTPIVTERATGRFDIALGGRAAAEHVATLLRHARAFDSVWVGISTPRLADALPSRRLAGGLGGTCPPE